MAVRFKFRSSVNFDSLSMGDQPSISVRDLKSKVLRLKNLNICQGFDLIFSDALTGQEYVDEDFQIPNGSCVIIKRVPAGMTHTDMKWLGSFKGPQSLTTEIVNQPPPAIADMNNMDDFGVDLYSVPGEPTLACDLVIDPSIQVDKMCIENERILKPLKGVFHKVEVSGLSEAIAEGPPRDGMEGNTTDMEIKPRTEDFRQVEKLTKDINPSLQKIDLLPELKCLICDSFCKDAMMIPCCQHSFCERCIRLVLVEMERCPKCHSTKCKVEDLLPNVSLRQVIEHFLNSQIQTGSHNALHQYASDGESEAQAKNVFYNIPTYKKDTGLPHSPCPTETGSNNIMEETSHDVIFQVQENASHGGVGSYFSHMSAKSCEKRHAPTPQKRVGSFNINLEKCQRTYEEGLSISKKKRSSRFDAKAAGGDKRSMDPMRHRKGNTTCYVCGSPDHLIRDCPAISTPYPMLQRETAMPQHPNMAPDSIYWNAASLRHGPTTPNRNHGMILFNTAMFPSGPSALPTNMPLMFGGVPSLRHACPVDDKILSVDTKKGHFLNGSGGRWSHCHPEQSSLEVEDFPCISCRSSIERRKKQPHRRSKRERERGDWVIETDSIQGRHQYFKERVRRKGVGSDNKSSHHRQCSPPESDLEQCRASEGRQHKLTSHGSTNSKYMVESVGDDLGHNRWQMISGLDDSAEEDYYYYKRKRAR